MWADIATLRDDHAAARTELDALSTFLGQPRGRLMEGAQRLVDHNQQLSSARASAVEECKRLERLVATWQTSAEQIRVERDKAAARSDSFEESLTFLRAKHGEATTALLDIGGALEVVGTGKPWAEIGKAGVAAVALLNTHLKTARQGWADESAAACRARVERDKSRAEVATLQEQVARLRADVTRAEQVSARYVSDALAGQRAAKDEVVSWETAAKMLLSPLSQDWSGDRLRARTFEYAMGGWQRAETLSRQEASLRTEVESLTAGLRSLREQRNGYGREVADLRERLAVAERIPRCLPLKDIVADRLEAVADAARPHSMACTPAGIHLGFALREGGGVALRLTRDEALELRGWLINASGLPAIEPRERSLRAVSGAVPQVVVNLGTGRTGFVRDPSTGELTPSLTPPPAPAAKPDPLAGLRAVLARVPELYSNLPVGDPRGVMAACNLYAAGWRADRPLAAAHRAMDWAKRQRQIATEAFSDGVAAGMGVDDTDRAA